MSKQSRGNRTHRSMSFELHRRTAQTTRTFYTHIGKTQLSSFFKYSETRLLRTLRGNEKRYVVTKVRSIQNAIFLPGRTSSTCSHERSATEDSSPSCMPFIICFSYDEIAFQGIVNLKTCREIEIETERLDDMLGIRKKKNQRLRAKKCSWRENWYVISDFVPRSVRLIRKKCTCFPIGDVRDRWRERYNRVYVLSRVRNNRVSL